MATFVLIHGGWGGGWEWRFVAPLLEAAGHTVYRPTLTGLGERRHLGRPETDLDTHVTDIVSLLEHEDLTGVTLLGHSYSGAVATVVVDRVPDRIARLVLLDAFVPRDGESVNSLSGERFAARVRDLAVSDGDGWQVPLPFPPDEVVAEFPVEHRAWYASHLGPHPLGSLEQPARLSGAGDEVPRTFILLRPPDAETWVFAPFAARAQAEGWDYHELPVGHDAQVIAPDRLAALLDSITTVAQDAAVTRGRLG